MVLVGNIVNSLAPGSNKLTVTIDGTDVSIDLNEIAIDHDALLNFEANEHLDWTQAGVGMIHTDNYIEGGAGKDTTALHDNVANEITAVTQKENCVASDEFILEDSEDSFDKKAISFTSLQKSISYAGIDNTALHDNQPSEITGIAIKTGLDDNDVIVIEDSDASYVKKKVTLSELKTYMAT